MKKSNRPTAQPTEGHADNVEFEVLAGHLRAYIMQQTDAEFLLEAIHHLDPNITLREAVLKLEALRSLKAGDSE